MKGMAMIGTSEENTPATHADVRRIVREEIAAWGRDIAERLDAAQREDEEVR